MSKLLPPCTYQGGKQRIATQILQNIGYTNDNYFVDMCCGSGAVSLELINNRFPSNQITMVDVGMWGLFWQMIADQSFSLRLFKKYIDQIPLEPDKIQSHAVGLASEPVGEDVVYIYLILQASNFGGKAVWHENERWVNINPRRYWMPTEKSSRRYPVNPMMPMPSVLYQRVESIYHSLAGNISAFQVSIEDFFVNDRIIYIDPPYDNKTGYGNSFDLIQQVARLSQNNFVYVSEAKPLTESNVLISSRRSKGNISGGGASNDEYLSIF